MAAVRIISMSAESSSRGDYIRRAERFKALTTFDWFLRGVQQTFQPVAGVQSVDLVSFYGDFKRLAREGAGLTEASLAELDVKLEAAAAQLRRADVSVPPSLMRRYFERVRPADGRIPFYMLRFYLLLEETDEDLLDKVDYLATVAAAGSPDPESLPVRSRAEIHSLFERLLADSRWPRIDREAVAEITRAFDEASTRIGAARGFEELTGEGLIESLRTLKRQASRGLANPEILTAAASCNLTARTVFRKFYEKEERALREMARRIDELEGRPRSGPEDILKLHRFRESRRELDRQVAEGNVRWRQLIEVHQAGSDALKMLSDAASMSGESGAGPEAGLAAELSEDRFWGPCLQRVLSAVESGDSVQSVEGWRALTDCKLEIWEAEAARRAIARRVLSKPERVVLFAASLRVKSEGETEAIRKSPGVEVSSDLVREARATLAQASGLDREFAGFAAATSDPAAAEEIRRWTRTRLRLLHATSALWLVLDAVLPANR
jgi:hypothetical protein